MILWHDTHHAFANDLMAKSWDRWKAGLTGESWGYTIPARLAYLCDAIVSLVAMPFAIIALVFGSLQAFFTWNSEPFVITKAFLYDKTNHFFLSAFGSIISPAIAHKYRDANLTPYVFALRMIVLLTVMCR